MNHQNEDAPPVAEKVDYMPWGMDEKAFCLLLHLSRLAGYVITPLIWILPLVMWLTNKEHSSSVDAHGKIVINWIITFIISCTGLIILGFFTCGIGWLLLVPLGILDIVWAIIGGVKANDSKVWEYPLNIKFIR